MPGPDFTHSNQSLPDVSIQLKPEFRGPLSRVGMRAIEMPIGVNVQGEETRLASKIEAFVSLDDADAKGIHMSRLYLEIVREMKAATFDLALCERLLSQFLETHKNLSRKAEVSFRFELPLKRKALVSELEGYRLYPVQIKAQKALGAALELELGAQILYSSTCPCSAALARELLREDFRAAFSEQKLIDPKTVDEWLGANETEIATPHAQRSLANVKIKVQATADLNIMQYLCAFIDRLELAVGTPVQAAVKRVDEQMFARLNGENLMFCEDAARKLRFSLEADAQILDYDIYVEHQESLHPHDAVSRVVKGVSGGYNV